MKTTIVVLALFAAIASSTPGLCAVNGSKTPTIAVPSSASELESLGVELSDSAMRLFVEGVRQKDLRTLGPMVSLKFKRTYTPDAVNAAFKQFFAVTVTGDPLAGKSPIFLKAPEITREGLLDVQGLYELPDGVLLFQLAFVREGSGWKLDGINVRSQPYDAPNAKPTTQKPLKFKIPAGKMVEA